VINLKMPPREFKKKQQKDFPHFAKLPAGLQAMVWIESLPGANIVTMRLDYNAETKKSRVKASYRIPRALLNCQLSRRVAQQYYKLSCASNLNGTGVHFHHDTDAILFDASWNVGQLIGRFCKDQSPSPDKLKYWLLCVK
jgi:hypothetical protein